MVHKQRNTQNLSSQRCLHRNQTYAQEVIIETRKSKRNQYLPSTTMRRASFIFLPIKAFYFDKKKVKISKSKMKYELNMNKKNGKNHSGLY